MKATSGNGKKGSGRDNVPGAFYDASVRVGAALAVTRCAEDHIAEGNGELISALEAIIIMLRNDMEKLEMQLIAPEG